MEGDRMSEEIELKQYQTFFKALADANRLKIIGLLAQHPCTVEQLAALLNVKPSTVSHHLARLSEAGLVRAEAGGHYFYYSLQLDILQKMSRQLLAEENLPRLAGDVDRDAYDRKVLAAFTDEAGCVTAFPTQEKKLLVILRYVIQAVEYGRRYTEKELNEVLSRFHEDTAFMRRSFIEYHMMERESNGSAYWRVLAEDH